MAHPVSTMLLALAAPTVAAVADPPLVVTAQLTIHERVVIRIPRARTAVSARGVRLTPLNWKERKGPKCLVPRELAAVAISAPTAVDLLLVDGRRMRAKLHRDCRSADFYSGLYIRPGADGRICADRDAIRVRSGAKCEIDTFKLLTPER